jgi:dTMP kinase
LRGLFITLEGIDFCGKSTQAALLARRWRETGREVTTLRDPGGTTISERVRAILLDRRLQEMHPVTELLLYEAARAQLVAERIAPCLERGEVVICDRFYDSTTAYQGYGRGLPLEQVELANRLGSQGLRPDLTIVIDITVEESLRRQQTLGQLPDRMEAQESDFRRRVREGYLEISRREPERIVVVNGEAPPEEVHTRIWRAVEQRLAHPRLPTGIATK